MILLPESISAEGVARTLTDATGPVVDASLAPAVRHDPGFPLSRRSGRFCALLSAARVYRGGVAQGVVGWAVARGHIAAAALEVVETVVSEALANAVIHGNLGFPGLEASGTDFEGFYAGIEHRLALPDHGLRPIGITAAPVGRLLIIHVDDVGAGYQPVPPGSDTSALSGRGLTLMRAFARSIRVSRGGRRTSLGIAQC